jgi:5-methylcytosine-specific restriction endonuclease McrA
MAPITTPHDRSIVTRAEARAVGAKRYFTGTPCKHGHIGERLVSCKLCIPCSVIRKALDKVERVDKSPPDNPAPKRCSICGEEKLRSEFTRQRDKADGLRSRCKACKKKESDAYYATNPEKCRIAAANYRTLNPEKARASTIAWQTKYPDRRGAASKAWHAANPEQNRANQHNRRAQKRKAGGKYTISDIRGLYSKQRGKCAYCRVSLKNGYHIDHIVALSKGGTNWISNIQLTCKKCNLTKHTRDPIDFAQSLGLLL